jgi:hypothetical protein
VAEKIAPVLLKEGTPVQHKIAGYRGRIDGVTAIKLCFTNKGVPLQRPSTNEDFQYRVAIPGETMRRIAPADDLEILTEEQSETVVCFNCHGSFLSKPGEANKVGGQCECGGWICPLCLTCQPATAGGGVPCTKQRARLIRKQAKEKKRNLVKTA